MFGAFNLGRERLVSKNAATGDFIVSDGRKQANC
jgi:hypothetical protein